MGDAAEVRRGLRDSAARSRQSAAGVVVSLDDMVANARGAQCFRAHESHRELGGEKHGGRAPGDDMGGKRR